MFHHHVAADAGGIGRRWGEVIVRWCRWCMNTRQDGAITGHVPLNLEHGFHGLAKESLTFFPDLECCPPSAAGGVAACRTGVLLGFGLQSELVVRGDGREGGLVGGDGRPEIGTSGIPLGPCSHGSAVVHALQRRRRVDEVATGEDIGLARDGLAIATT
ncbi:hypothetical protein PG999_004680 [Apiospora kogelbergensis]|uniref:Uncharacterized protein n=1 Tax=Apiospora kogelbergensis TaxID=1337665 RepID=A0AAW0R025_9PEZI